MQAKLVLGDSRVALRRFPSNFVDCVVTSPPYFNLRDYGHPDQIGTEQTLELYLNNLLKVFKEVHRVLKPQGVVWVNLGDSYAKDKSLHAVPWQFALAMKKQGWILRQDIIWNKPNVLPESVKDRCTKSHEYIFMFVKSTKYLFESERIREPLVPNSDVVYRQHLRSKKKYNQKSSWDKNFPKSFDIVTKNARSVWNITTKPYKGAHCAVFPPDLVERCIKAGTNEKHYCAECGTAIKRIVIKGEVDLQAQKKCGGNSKGKYTGKATKDYKANKAQDASATKKRILEGMRKRSYEWQRQCLCKTNRVRRAWVLDPFGGSGTTSFVAAHLGCNSIYVDLNKKYRALACERLKHSTCSVILLNATKKKV